MSVPGKRVLFLVVDWHSRHVYNRQPCFELIYVAQGVQETNIDAWYFMTLTCALKIERHIKEI